jgi:hypothetical protein
MRRTIVLTPDLILASRVSEALAGPDHRVDRVEDPADLSEIGIVDALVVDWAYRQPAWADAIRAWAAEAGDRPRILLVGPHSDLEAHADARRAALGPMRARSRLADDLRSLAAALDGA